MDCDGGANSITCPSGTTCIQASAVSSSNPVPDSYAICCQNSPTNKPTNKPTVNVDDFDCGIEGCWIQWFLNHFFVCVSVLDWL